MRWSRKFEKLSLEFALKREGKCYEWNFARKINLDQKKEFGCSFNYSKFRDGSSIHEFLHVASNICAHLERKEIHACCFFFFSRQDNRDMSVWCVELRHQRRYLRSRLGKRRTNVARKQRSGSRERVADQSILRLIGS